MSDAHDTTSPDEALELLEHALKRFSFHGSLATLNLRCEVRKDDFSVVLDTIITVPDRDTGLPSEVHFTKAVEPWFLLRVRHPEQFAQQMLTQWFREVWRHEFDEGLQFDGVRPFDPHPAGKP